MSLINLEYIKNKYKSAKLFVLQNRVFTGIFLFGIIFELFIFYRLPKQAWVEGLLESWYTHNGLIFYRDFINQYFPFLHMLMVPFHMVFGFTQTPTLILALINSLVVLTLLFFVSCKWLTGWRRVIPLVFFLLWDPMLSENHFSTVAFQELVNFVAFILWLYWDKNPNKWLAFFLGFFLSAAVFSLHIVAFFAAAVFLAMGAKILIDKKYHVSLIYSALGFSIPVIIILAWFIYKNAVYDLLWWNTIYYIKYYPYAQLGRDPVSVIMFLAIFSPIIFYLKLTYDFYFKKASKKINKELQNRIISLSLILLTLPGAIWFAIFHHTRFQIALPIFAFVLGLAWELIKTYHFKIDKLTILITASIIVLNVLSIYFYMIPKYKSSLAYSRQHNIITKLYQDDPMYTAVQWIKNNTPKKSKLFVLADPLFYLETGRLPVNARGTMNQPFVYEPLSQMSLLFEKKPPDYWVVDERLIHQRFHEFGYDHTTVYFDKLLNCEPVVARIEYITIRKHIKGVKLCF